MIASEMRGGALRRLLPRRARRVLVWVLLLASPAVASAQAKVQMVGLVSHNVSGTPGFKLWTEGVDAFRQELQRLGHVEGQTVALQLRLGGEAGVRELLQAGVDVLVAAWSPSALAARRATTSVPIVAVGPRDPVEQGLVQSLARPGGNVTGIASTVADLRTCQGKRIEVLRELVPGATHLGYVSDLSFPGTEPYVRMAERCASQAGLVVHPFDIRSEAALDGAFKEMIRTRVHGVVVGGEMRWTPRIVALAARHRLPAVYTLRHTVDEGGLVAWDIDRMELFRRGAYLVDRILKGAKPAELPFEQPTKFEIAINLRTARALGLSVPPSLMLRATHVVE